MINCACGKVQGQYLSIIIIAQMLVAIIITDWIRAPSVDNFKNEGESSEVVEINVLELRTAAAI